MTELKHDSHENDSLIDKSEYSKFEISSKDKLELIENQKNQDFFDVYDLVGSYKYRESLNDHVDIKIGRNFSIKKSQSLKSEKLPKEDELENGLDEEKIIDSEQKVNSRESSLHSYRYIFAYFLFTSMICIQIITAFLYYEIDFKMYYLKNALNYADNTNPSTYPLVQTLVSQIQSNYNIYLTILTFTIRSFYVSTIIANLSFTLVYMGHINWKKSLHIFEDDVTFVNSPEFDLYLFEIIILSIVPLEIINNISFDYTFIVPDPNSTIKKVTREIKVNHLILVIFFVSRIIFLIKCIMISCYYYSPRSQRFCKIFCVDLNYKFVAKCLFRAYPFYVVLIFIVLNLFMGAYLIRIFERLNNMVPNSELNSLFVCIWYSFISMMTVGYGDFLAVTIFGRVLVLAVSLNGVFILAIITVMFNEGFTFKGGQLKAYTLLKNIYSKEEISNKVKKLIISSGMIIINTRRKKKNTENLYIVKNLEDISNKLKRNLFKILNEIKILNKKFEMSTDVNYIDLFNDQLAFVRNQLKDMEDIISNFSTSIEVCNDNRRDIITIKNNLLT